MSTQGESWTAAPHERSPKTLLVKHPGVSWKLSCFPNSNSSHFKLPVLQGWVKEWIQVMNGGHGVELSHGQECGLCKRSGLSAGRNDRRQKCSDLLAYSLASVSVLLMPSSILSHLCHREQHKGMARFWYSQAPCTRTDTVGLRISIDFLTK